MISFIFVSQRKICKLSIKNDTGLRDILLFKCRYLFFGSQDREGMGRPGLK